MSKTDQMRALREARFTRSSTGASRRVSPASAAAAVPRSAAPTTPIEKPATVEGPAPIENRAPTVELVPDVAVIDVSAGPLPAIELPPFEVPTLDIPIPASVPRVRETPSPMPSARFSEVSLAPTPEQIVIPALYLPSPDKAIEADKVGEVPELIGHGILPGQPIAAYSQVDLAAVVRWVERDAKPRDAAALVAAVMVELGFKRKGTKITAAITSAAASIGALPVEPVATASSLEAIAS